MLRDMTLGQYYPTKSKVHKTDPRVKLLATLLFVVGLFLVNSFLSYIFSIAIIGITIGMSKVPFSYMIKGMKFILVLLIISAVFNIIFTNGEHMYFEYGIIKISAEGLKWAVFIVIRLMLIVLGCSIVTYTTTPNDLTAGLEKGLSWMRKIKVPVHEIAMMMSIALRFIPILVEEADKIMKAQSARGADFDSGNIIAKAKNMIPVIVPLFISAFRRASELATAMESRCYRGGEGRTKFKPLVYKLSDKLSYAFLALYFVIIIDLDLMARNIEALNFMMAK
ncbi:MAG: energy-coupling factor transporter transmembrane protein EcfT [Lachnospiraceae bacterium]|nr:energy-coupling factor transporter transmembrane protein EcfT [Lachnospiraceae bacterium]